ncbi:MAG: 3-deoxy-manno-octulosonate cytidylyltransferase [Mucilaginibacter polytrichastri]|nr:3-deoxy-manno-octulosonate cytidylyltransferase [Mucilaginibacter polytrichastri]
MNILGIIPARFASTRFPGKPLVDIGGKTMIERVFMQAKKASSLHDVIVATDDDRIFAHVLSFGGNVIRTASTHQSGTDRCAEVAAAMPGFDAVINIQGDEPFIDPEQINQVAGCFSSSRTQIATLAKKITDEEQLFSPNTVKVVFGHKNQALYFSRSVIPFLRGEDQRNWGEKGLFYKHIGLYGYKTDILAELTRLPVSALERTESLEQLRWLENGYAIYVAETDRETPAVDTPADLEKLKALL